MQVTSSNDPSVDPKFSPDGSRIAYVRKHNLYVRDVTRTGRRSDTRGDDNLLNGEVDWVYEEELDVRSNYFWSPDGKQIAFLQMNENRVPDYPITDWIPMHSTVDQQKYPKAGDPNPVVRLGVVSSDGGKVKWLSAGGGAMETSGDDSNVYIPRFGWVRPGIVWAMALNRAQDRLDLYFIDVKSGKSRLMMSESSDTWIDMHSDDEFHLLRPAIAICGPAGATATTTSTCISSTIRTRCQRPAKLVAQLTHGDWDVESIDAIDEPQGVVYFTANKVTGGRPTCFPWDWTARISVASLRKTAPTSPTSVRQHQALH